MSSIKNIKTNVLGYPRIGKKRELKKACEAYWAGKINRNELENTARNLRRENWNLLQKAGIDLIPSNDFSYYDTTLDLTLTLGAIPSRYNSLKEDKLRLYFAMAHGEQNEQEDVIAMEMTKWFDTNYHYIVPEFVKDQEFSLFDTKVVDEFCEALELGIKTKPVILSPVSFLFLGKEKEDITGMQDGFHRLDLLDKVLPVYVELLKALEEKGAEWIQIDEPYLALDLDDELRNAIQKAFSYIRENTRLKIIVATYFDGLKDNADLAVNLPVEALHIDLARCPEQLDSILNILPADKILSLGVVDGRNIWKNDLEKSIELVNKATGKLGADRVFVAGSCSFLHVPYDLALETKEQTLPAGIKRWMAFAAQKIEELAAIKALAGSETKEGFSHQEKTAEQDYAAGIQAYFTENQKDIADRKFSFLIHNPEVKARVDALTDKDSQRHSAFEVRQKIQHSELHLPLYPTTTIGSFPQTKEVRSWRSKFRKGEISAAEYNQLLKEETRKCIEWQEEIGLDVLVHGEFERNDMVEYFGEQLAGFAFTQNGWVQSYGSRCVKPPVIYGDVERKQAMTVDWSTFAQSCTQLPMKGMLTGPVTILEWSFVRNDQPRSLTCKQIALAIRDEVCDLERHNIRIIQIDEPAIREGLPLRKSGWDEYLKWAVESFRISASGVEDKTQIHTHMCYSEFNDIIEHIAAMDADVITIECSRSQMELLNVFADFHYPNEIGPGVYDIHSARVPETQEMVDLLKKAERFIDKSKLWVNPDCGLKTRGWAETKASLIRMVEAAKELRNE